MAIKIIEGGNFAAGKKAKTVYCVDCGAVMLEPNKKNRCAYSLPNGRKGLVSLPHSYCPECKRAFNMEDASTYSLEKKKVTKEVVEKVEEVELATVETPDPEIKPMVPKKVAKKKVTKKGAKKTAKVGPEKVESEVAVPPVVSESSSLSDIL